MLDRMTPRFTDSVFKKTKEGETQREGAAPTEVQAGHTLVAASHRLCLLASFLTGLQVEAYLEKALDSASRWKHAAQGEQSYKPDQILCQGFRLHFSLTDYLAGHMVTGADRDGSLTVGNAAMDEFRCYVGVSENQIDIRLCLPLSHLTICGGKKRHKKRQRSEAVFWQQGRESSQALRRMTIVLPLRSSGCSEAVCWLDSVTWQPSMTLCSLQSTEQGDHAKILLLKSISTVSFNR
ncbi:unnamed protein product [Arctogadus glacialis]